MSYLIEYCINFQFRYFCGNIQKLKCVLGEMTKFRNKLIEIIYDFSNKFNCSIR